MARQHGKSLPETGYDARYVTIYRAVLQGVIEFNPMDYVTLNKRWAVEHAEHTAAVEEEPAVVLQAMVKAADVYEAYNPGEYFYDGPPVRGKVVKRVGVTENPGPATEVAPSIAQRYKEFHGVEPNSYSDVRLQMPDRLVTVGQCLDCGYAVTDRRSSKSGRYVHDHEGRVKLYEAVNGRGRGTPLRNPPKQLIVLGSWLGCTFKDRDGEEHEIAGSSAIKACTDNGKRLFAIHRTKGCLYVIKGGDFRITDWMYD